MDSAAYPAIEPATDDIDALLGATGAGIARTLYQGQKADLARLALRLRATPSTTADRRAAAILLHRLAGTAAYFGDELLGAVAGAAAEPIDELSAAHIVMLCDRLLPLLEG